MALILAVDDSFSMRELVAGTLEQLGHKVVRAADGAEGLAAAKKERPQLVITDINMPNMNGLELLKALKTELKLSAPVLVLTTEINAELKAQAKAAGAAGWLVKPFQAEALLQTVRKVLP